MITILSDFLGRIMKICYTLLPNYALAIIFFTLLTKVILFPLSIWVHKNSIKMIHMQPEINRTKVKFYGVGDQIAEELSQLYKREKYNPLANLIPLIIQIVLLMGLIQVIYNPLTHIYCLDHQLIQEFILLTGQLTNADISSASVQMAVVDVIKNPDFYNSFLALQEKFHNMNISDLLNRIRDANMTLMHFSMALIPMQALGATLLMPLAAGFSAWLMCIAQNHWNPLQAEQGKWNQFGMTAFSVGLSLFLGGFVPLGVGFYWILSNLLTIIQQLILNAFIDPKKYIDYEALEESKQELKALESLGASKDDPYGKEFMKREKADYKRFFSIANKHLVFYSEGGGFYKYFETLIEYLCNNTNIVIHYITSDPNDQVFKKANSRFKVYYIGPKKLITLMMKMDADIVVMTMPDLDNFHIKRSYVRKDIEYIYIPHGMDSLNMTMRTGSMDHFDTVFCVGSHQKIEIEKIEILHNTSKKTLVQWGYGLLDKMIADYEKLSINNNNKKQIIIAPSWQEGNIIESCLEELLDVLQGNGWHLTVRPHPQHVRHYPEKMELLKEKYAYDPDIVIQTDFSSNSTVFEADILVTDWSAIAYEFAYTTCHPVLFINTPMKVMNPEYEKINCVPLNIILRDEIGCSLNLHEICNSAEKVKQLLTEDQKYTEKIRKFVETYVYNIGKSDIVGGKYITNQLITKKQTK